MAHSYRTFNEAVQSLRSCGYDISQGLMPKSIGPLIICITGTGNVSKVSNNTQWLKNDQMCISVNSGPHSDFACLQGVQTVLSNLPVEYVDVHQLKNVCEKGGMFVNSRSICAC